MRLATDTIEESAPAEPARGRRIGLRTVLTGLVVAAVLLTASIVHWSWSRTARDNTIGVRTMTSSPRRTWARLRSIIKSPIWITSLSADANSPYARRSSARTRESNSRKPNGLVK